MYSLETVIEENIAVALGSSAESYRQRGDLKMSKKLYREALKVREALSVLDKSYFQPLVVETLERLAVLSVEENQYAEAIGYYRRAMEGLEELARVLPQRYTQRLIKGYTTVGDLYRKSLQYREAERFYQKVITLYQGFTPEELEATRLKRLHLYLNYALVLRQRNQFDLTKEAYMGALNIYGTLIEEGSSQYREEMATTLFDLGTLYFEHHRQNKAGEVFLLVLEMLLSLPESGQRNYPILAKSFYLLAQIYTAQLEYVDGVAAYRESLKYYIALADEQPLVYGTTVAEVFADLARCYDQQDKKMLAQHFQEKVILLYTELNHYHQFKYDFELAQSIVQQVDAYGAHTIWLHQAVGILMRHEGNSNAQALLDRIHTLREKRCVTIKG